MKIYKTGNRPKWLKRRITNIQEFRVEFQIGLRKQFFTFYGIDAGKSQGKLHGHTPRLVSI